jgi:hypothetical protein
MFRNNKEKIIKVGINTELYIDLVPRGSSLPKWYKDAESWTGTSNTPKIENYSSNKGVKLCIPFLDSLRCGYDIPLWTDIQVEEDGYGGRSISWMQTPDPIFKRDPKNNSTLPVPAGHLESAPMSWILPFFIKTPPGYSSLISHPFNRYDLPFTTLTAIVDTDATLYPGFAPFFIRSDFTGIIPKGTPIMSILPFKRDNWTHERDDSIIKEGLRQKFESASVLSGFYKKNIWKKKNFS